MARNLNFMQQLFSCKHCEKDGREYDLLPYHLRASSEDGSGVVTLEFECTTCARLYNSFFGVNREHEDGEYTSWGGPGCNQGSVDHTPRDYLPRAVAAGRYPKEWLDPDYRPGYPIE